MNQHIVEVTCATSPANLKYAHEDLATQEEKSNDLGEPSSPSGMSEKRTASWAKLDSDPEQVREEPHWPKLLADHDSLVQAVFLRSRVRPQVEDPDRRSAGLHTEGHHHL